MTPPVPGLAIANATPTLPERFHAKYVIDESTGCWNWTGHIGDSGSGLIRIGGKNTRIVSSHRVSYELHVGQIPDGLVLDHLCRNRACVNPAHLEPVTMRENTLRGETIPAANVAKTRCIHGHPFAGDNLEILPSGERRCKTCKSDCRRRFWQRHGR